MKALLVTENAEVKDAEQAGLEDLQSLVGGWIQALPFPDRNDVTCYINEEGKLDGLPANLLATEFLKSILLPGDVIVGPMVLCGFDPETGENKDVPEELREELGEVV